MGVNGRDMRTKIITAVVIVLFASLAIYSYTSQQNKLHLQQVELQKLNIDKKVLESESVKRKRTIDKLNSRIEELHKSGNEDKSKIDELNKQLDNAMQQLQAKAEEKNRLAKASTDVINVATNTRVASASSISGCDNIIPLLLANGISQSDLPYALNIARVESTCNSAAQNPSSGACNLFQELSCGKWGGLANTPAHIRGADNYAKTRYGGWANAWAAWQSKHWW